MGRKGNKGSKKGRQGLKDWVVYVVSVASIKCSTDTADEAREFACQEVMSRLATADSMVHIPKVAVMEASFDEEAKQHLAELEAPWLMKDRPEGDQGEPINPFEDSAGGDSDE